MTHTMQASTLHGTYEAGKAGECVLMFDPQRQAFVLERQVAAVKVSSANLVISR